MQIIKRLSLYLSVLWWTALLCAQTEPPSDIQLDELREWLQENWHEGHHQSLGYNQARIQMYGYIDNFDGEIE